MSLFAHTCSCGHRIDPGARCPVCEKPRKRPTEAQRYANNPNRASYGTAKYRRNRWERYRACGGRCECGCDTPLRGPLHPDGAPWECHHVTQPTGDRDDTQNLRCLAEPHHNRYTL